MSTRWLVLVGFLLFYGALESYVYSGVKAAFEEGTTRRVALALFWVGLLTTASTFGLFFVLGRGAFGGLGNWLIGLMITFLVTKLSFALVLLAEDAFRLARFGVAFVASMGQEAPTTPSIDSRRSFLGYIGLAIAAIPFSAFLYGITKGKYDFRVRKVELAFADLPKAFDGLRIAHISDVHAGSFDDFEAVKAGIAKIQGTQPDLILFTGDLVNNRAAEIEPYIPLFRDLHATYGKFSVLGNHDYGHYVPWPSHQAWHQNLQTLFQHHDAMGFKLLNNAHTVLKEGKESLCVAGVENWGKPPFPQRGDLTRALTKVEDEAFTILLSHDPSHWDVQVLPHQKKIHLTLSGHTHGMQMGIEIPGFKWSPVKYRYPRWAGAYEVDGQHLYVNRGFGFLGFPGRVGMWPEITLIELKTA